MSIDSLKTSSRVWSCSTLRDGAEFVLQQAQELHDEEAYLEKLVEDSYHHVIFKYSHFLTHECFTFSKWVYMVTPKTYFCSISLVSSFFPAGLEAKKWRWHPSSSYGWSCSYCSRASSKSCMCQKFISLSLFLFDSLYPKIPCWLVGSSHTYKD